MKASRVIFLFSLFVSVFSQAKVLDKIVAVVQGKAILLSDIQSLRQQIQKSPLLKNFYPIEGDLTDEKLLNRLVENQIIRARLKEIGSEITAESVNREIDGIAKKNKISSSQLKQMLKQQGVDFENYFNALKSSIERRSLFHREIQSGGSTLSDEELKSIFKNKAPVEYKLGIIVEKNSLENQKVLEDIKKQFKTGKLPPEKLKDYPGYVELGWLPLEEVSEAFKKQLSSASQSGEAFGPLKRNEKLQLLLVENTRKGTDEQFIASKDRFKDSVEEEELGKKFKIWIEKKKNELEVTINPL
jgi:peptidyl-prolyl cis-trans isomerase SurA